MKQDMNDTFRIALRAMVVAAMTLLAGSTATAQVEVHGNVYGGGNLADVKENTAVNMSAGQVYGNVYGGGKGKADTFTCEKAMVGSENEGASADLTTPENKDKGTKVTISNGTVGTLEGEEEFQTLKEGTGNVYGGGEIGRVEWNTQVRIGVGTDGTEGGTFAPVIYGNVFGAGKGLETHGYSALVRGNSTVTIQGNAKVGYNVYGGGEMSTVGRYWVKGINNNVSGAPEAPSDLPVGMPYQQQSGGKCSVTIQGSAIIGSLGIDDKGHVFGAGKGVNPHYSPYNAENLKNSSRRMADTDEWVYFTDDTEEVVEELRKTGKEKYLQFLQTLSLVTNSYVTIDGSAKVIGSVFGGSESGFVQHDTNVTIQGSDCEIGTDKYGNIFGGGKGLEDFAEAGKVKGNTTVTISSGTVKGNVYGGGRLGDVGTIDKTNKNDKGELTYNYFWKQSNGTTANVGEHNTNATADNTGICTVSITGGTIGLESTNEPTKHGNVFGAGRGLDDTWWCEKAIAYATSVAISNTAVVKGNVYGGGQIGRVEDDAKVVIGTADGADEPDIRGSVFGAGAGLQTHGYSALVRGNATVTVQGKAKVGGSVYGGGETASVGKFEVVGGLPTKPKTGGTCIVNIKDNAKIGSSGTGHNVYGACKGVEPTYVASGENRSKSMQLLTNAPSDNNLWSHYEDDESSPFIWRYYATKQDYLDFLKTLALTSHPHVTIGGTWTPNGTTGTITASGSPTVYGSVYGGGQRGVTLGHVDVNMVGGTVEQDVYGGGALADTNLGNWDANHYEETTAHNEGEDLYTRTGEEGNYIYTKVTDISATSGPYYRQVPTWAHDEGSAYYTTSVDLTGGTIKGDAYGGGLGQRAREAAEGVTALDDVPAYVFGDVTVKLNEGVATDAKGAIVNRVFAANNLNGSPQGNTSVYVYATQSADAGHTTIASKFEKHTGLEAEGAASTYDVQAVYGGGNEASYLPKSPYTAENTTGAKSQVIIEGCDLTSIKTVYGGGNAASVPETNVTVKSVYEIEDLFGGGNGKDDTSYGKNPGADIGVYKNASNSDVLYGTGNVNVTTQGGYIHELFGASNQKGSIKGDVALNMTQVGTCTLQIDKVYNAGRNADIEGNLISVLSCQPATKILEYYGGAENANVKGNVELTITNGWFEKVFAGNNQSGSIFGHIKLNVEETGCSPIRIDELYGCGNDAAYSVYGYYVQTEETQNGSGSGAVGEHPSLNNEKLVLLPRTSADDPHKPVKTFNHETQEWTVYAGDNSDPYPRYDDPEVNIVSATYIGKVFGGGYGANGTVYGNPQVNINMIKGAWAGQTYGTGESAISVPNQLGEIGIVYGGGNEANVVGNTFVNIGTKDKVKLHLDYNKMSSEYKMSEEKTVEGAYITGNVYGGGKGVADNFLCDKAMIGINDAGADKEKYPDGYPDGNTNVIIGNGTVNGSVYGGGEVGRVEMNTTVTIGLAGTTTSNPDIKGNVFGGGKGDEEHGYAALVRGNPTVTIQANAKVEHNVYGGGEIASVARYKVPRTDEDVAAAIAEGYTDAVKGRPYALKDVNSGFCTVNVLGNAVIGPDTPMKMYHKVNDVIPADDAPDDAGHVFGAGKGILPKNYAYDSNEVGHKPRSRNNEDGWDWFDDVEEYIAFIKTLALSSQTTVTIGDENDSNCNPFVKGSVYGGSENGIVQFDTNVNIKSGQIGCGKNATVPYENYVWVDGYEPEEDLECASWDYGMDTNNDGKKDLFAPYDPNANATGDLDKYPAVGTASAKSTEGGRKIASDGHTYYGNVFGGGSGSVPYFDTAEGVSQYIMSAGWVKGNTNVTISGGHILTNVYGGNEATNVDGTATVKMTGGTIGVPRTLAQIDAHPVTCYLFGAGKGDQRVLFNKDTNVKDVVVEITGGKIYGSVFGGGEDGHVLRDVTMTIGTQTTTGEGAQATTTTSGPTIGTWGTSYVDGNVFGGGRGFGGDAYTAGNVAGCVTMNINGGTMLGSIYGGGRLGSVGYGLFDATESGYGEMRTDDAWEEGFSSAGYFTKGRGHIDITISGGTIGNTHEYIMPNNSNIPTGLPATISDWTTENWNTWKAHNHISKTEFDTATGRLTHTKGGNVFAGGMGRFYQLDGTTPISVIDWWKLGNVKSTKLTITGGNIKSNVYGGGEQGWTSGYHTADGKNLSTEISITGGTIGTEVAEAVTTGTGSEATTSNIVRYTFGSVFGGGYGSALEKLVDDKGKETNPKFQAGRVKYSTKVDITSDAKVLASVYGGGEVASVGYGFYSYHDDQVIVETPLSSASDAANTYVSISGNAVIGKDKVGDTYFGGANMGNVYGGGSGNRTIVRCGLILGNTNVNISGGTIYHNIYGGGAYGSVGDFEYETREDPVQHTMKVYGVKKLHTTGTGTANVTIIGGTIGIDGRENGMVFGSSRGDVIGNLQRDDYMAWVNEAKVTIGTSGATTGPTIAGSVYGSGENGHTLSNTNVAIHSGTIGILSGSPVTGSSGKEYNGAEYPYRGNVYGGGCGTDTYTDDDGKTRYNPLAGIVMGNATVTMDGGRVARTIYGGGAMGSVGTFTYADATYHTEHTDVPLGKPYSCTERTGLCTVTISGGSVGPDVLAMPNNYGNVFGAGRGEVHDPAEYANLETSGYVNKTEVTVSGSAFVRGSVYGGAESGHVLADTHVKIEGGQIGCGKTTAKPYGDNVWAADYTPTDATDLECASWPYEAPYTPYDKFARADGTYPDGSSADNAHPTGTDGHTFYGNVFGGGSGYEPYAAGKWLPTAGWVEGNTTVEITGGHILTSVYGGNEMTDVGQGGVRKMTDLANETADMFYDITKPGGRCTVKMSGGTLGVPRTLAQIAAHPVTCYLFGAGKGDQRIFFNKITNVNNVEVEISGTARIYGSVFGGGEDGHVMRDVKMTIKGNAYIGNYGTSYVEGNVFGGGRGFSGEALTAGNVGGCVNIDIQGGTMLGSVYGGGRLGSVGHGLYLVDEEITIAGEKVKPYGILRPDNQDDRGNKVENFERGNITINISGGTIGNDLEYKYNPTDEDKQKMPNTQFDYQNHVLYTKGGNVFAGCMGRLYSLDGKLLTLWPELGRCKNTVLNITGGHIKSNVYGGAELGVVQENTKVSITGGTIGTTVGTGDDAYVYGSAFGGGKGSNDAITYPDGTPEENKVSISEAGTVLGNVEVELNKGVAESENKKGGIVNKIFGCNDSNGTPKGTVTVHVYATQTPNTDKVNTKQGKDLGKYDVETVYGGGNLAAYNPDDADSKVATVIIGGCELTSIETVYGGGNAASVPATNVTVNGTYEIGYVFGGGNGMDKLPSGDDNPGANVGYFAYTDDSEKESKVYGSGKAHATIYSGMVHKVYGGSNTKGNVRVESRTTLIEEETECEYDVREAYGGGNNALQDGNSVLEAGCIRGLDIAYGGASNADVNGDVILNITNGTYGRVFAGNNLGGTIRGTITVNIEETGCRPIIIGELYGGGNLAKYSVEDIDKSRTDINFTDPTADNYYKNFPKVNVKSFTSIGKIFGGGYGKTAKVTGNPQVNINVCEGKYCNTFVDQDNVINDNAKVVGVNVKYSESDAGYANGYPIPSHAKGAIGAINDVFGGGNEAEVIGNPTVNIGTEAGEEVYAEVYAAVGGDVSGYYTRIGEGTDTSPYIYSSAPLPTGSKAEAGETYCMKTQKAVDIRGNVFGGGNNAPVTGNTNVVIGKKAE